MHIYSLKHANTSHIFLEIHFQENLGIYVYRCSTPNFLMVNLAITIQSNYT